MNECGGGKGILKLNHLTYLLYKKKHTQHTKYKQKKNDKKHRKTNLIIEKEKENPNEHFLRLIFFTYQKYDNLNYISQ